MQKEKINSILFDLDGTLVDSLQDIADSMNAVLSSWSCPTHPTEAYRTFVGDGMETLALRVLPEKYRNDTEHKLACVSAMKEEYAKRWNVHSTPYAGIEDLLFSCVKKNIRLGILSNKPEAFTKEMVNHLFPEIPFATVRGAREGIPVKPDPAAAHAIRKEWDTSPGSIAYVGDTDTDMKTGRAAGFWTVGVSWGFRNSDELVEAGADLVVDRPSALLQAIR
jgi:phosphoglycolate phosphatase